MTDAITLSSPSDQQTRDYAGRFVYIESASGPVYVVATLEDKTESGIELEARDQARFDQRFTKLRFLNRHSGTNTITVKASDAQYFPRQDGGAVTIAGQAAPLDVEVVNTTPQEVTVNGGVSATITDPVEVFTDALAPLHVNPVQIEPGVQPITVDNSGGFGVVIVPGASITTPAEILPDVTGATIPANANRMALILKVDPANAGLIWLSSAAGTGIPLQAGDPPLRLDTDAAVNLIAANNTDKIYLMEIIE